MPDVDIDLVKPSPYQPRLDFDLEDLKGSITRYGIRAPLTVRQRDNYYELIDGERRLRLAKELGYETVPCHVTDVDDEAARRLVWQMNTLRKPYAPKETAFHLQKLQEKEGLSMRAIGRECGYSDTEVRAYLGIFKLPEEYQKYVWLRKIGVGDMVQLLPFLNGSAIRIAEVTDWLDQRLSGSLRSKEELGKAVRPTLKKLEEERVRKAQEAVGEVAPEVTLETPEDYEKAAQVLKEEAKKRKIESLTPKERAALVAQKEQEAIEREQRKKEAQRKREEARQREIEEEARKRAEEIIKDTNFVKEFVDREYILTADHVKAEDLRDALMQKLMANIPEGKRERAKDIFNEEFRSLQKRLDIFPEKSQKMEPKFEQLATWEERGIIPYTIWDFTYRDDYAGDKDFHGNCSPQIVEQCIWRFTEEGDLVVDPMAGSGTAIDVCERYNRESKAYDINPARSDIEECDSRKMPLDSNTVDMVFIHPPYWNLVNYTTNADGKSGDLSRAPSLEAYLDMLRQVFTECRRVLKPSKHMCVLIGDLVRDGQFIPLCRKVSDLAEDLNFIDRGYAVKLAHGEVSRKKSGVIVAELAYTNNLKISHDLVLFLRKGES